MTDTRRYQWMIGGLGVVLLVAFSVFMLGHGHAATVGVPAGQRMRPFVAPLATAGGDATANVSPRCDPLHPAQAGLNVCNRQALVLDFFVPGARRCVQAVNGLNSLAAAHPRTEFGAVAVGASRSQVRMLVHKHRWTIPVAYDSSGAVGALYDVTACPLIELVRPGGVVARRLIGNHWAGAASLREAVAGSL